eukprot:65012_1
MVLRYAVFIQSVYLAIATWIVSDNMTWINHGHAVGVHDNTIYILGGWSTQKQVVQYQWNEWLTNTVVDVQNDTLTINQAGSSQYWSQFDNNLYLIAMEENQLAVFDLATNTLNPDVSTFALGIGNTDRSSACLASYGPFVFVMGGSNQDVPLNTVQVLNTNALQWITNVNVMQHSRKGCASIVHSSMYLYVFGGWARDTVERVSIVDISQKQWEWAGYLTATAYQPRCASWGDNIYIVGGCSCEVSRSSWLNSVHVLSTTAVTMYEPLAVLKDPMPYPGANVAPIVVDGVLYVFGGFRDADGNKLHQLAYYMLRTATPTNVPIDEPSAAPTRFPSATPTVVPSDDPSAAPTRLLSLTPTAVPSDGPSAAPISQSTSPSHTFHPSHNPSRNPSHNPSDKPTAFPSHNPSKRPIIFSSAKPSINPSERPTQNPHKEEGRITTTNIINSDHMEPKQMDTVMIYAVSGSVLMVLLLASIVLIVFILKYKRDINERLVHSATTTGETEGQKTTDATGGSDVLHTADVRPQTDGITYGQQTMNTTVGRNRLYTVDSIGPQTMNSTVGRNRIYTTDIISPQTMDTTYGFGVDVERPLPVEAIQHARYKPQICVECGVMIKQEMIQMYGTGVSVCATCKSLECDDVDDAVDEMFDPQYTAKHRNMTAGGDPVQTAGGGYHKRTAGGDPQIHELDESDDNDSATLDEVEGDGKDDEKPYDYTQGIKQTNRGGVMETAGNYEKEEQKDDVLLNSVEMQNVDPNKMHQMNLNNCVNRYRARSNSYSD